MKNLMYDTLVWFGGFFAVSLGLLLVARQLTQRSRGTAARTSPMTEPPPHDTIEQSGAFAAGLSLLWASVADDTKREASIPLEGGGSSHGIGQVALVVAAGSLAGGVMWSVTAQPRSWTGALVGLTIAGAAGVIGYVVNRRRTPVASATSIALHSRRWADLLELLALRWTTPKPHADAVRSAAAAIEPHDADLAALAAASADELFPESPLGREIGRYHQQPWPDSTADQTAWLLEASCRMRSPLAHHARVESRRIGRSMKFVIWLCLAPSLYLMLLTPPLIEMISFLRPRETQPRQITADELLELQRRDAAAAANAGDRPSENNDSPR